MASKKKEQETSNADLSFLTESIAAKEAAEKTTAVKETLYVGNTSTSPRGFMLKKRLVVLAPYEIKHISLEQEDEVRALFKTKAMQAMVDSGLFQIGNSPIIQLKKQPTPKPPAELENNVTVKSTGAEAVAGSSTKQVGGTEKMRLDSTVTTNVQ